MAPQLERSKSGTRAVRRIIGHELEKALEALGGETSVGDEAVHNARKRLKRVRASLRLLRPALGNRRYHEENQAIRDAARPLTEVRDSKVLLETLEKLAGHYPRALGAKSLQAARTALEEHQAEVRRRVLEQEDVVTGVQQALAKALKRAKKWKIGRRGWSLLGGGLERVYREGRTALRQVAAEATTERLHEWRKQAKYLWHELQILEPIAPDLLGPLSERAHRLGDLLGDDHDLAVLGLLVVGAPARFGGPEGVVRLVGLIERRRTELQQEARELGGQLFAEKPKSFLSGIEAAWRAWRRDMPRAASA